MKALDIIMGEALMLPAEIANMIKLAGKKRRQHYVFQHYLKAWVTDRNVWVRRRGDGKAFPTRTLNVAVQKDFYKLQPVTAEDLALIRIVLDDAPIYVKERCELLIHNFTVPLSVKKILDPAGQNFEEISAWLDERIINAEEDFHCDIEEGLVSPLHDMLSGRTDFYSDSESAQEFIHAICIQYMRTKKRREALAAVETKVMPGADVKRCASLFALITAMRFADSLYSDRSKYKIVLLANETGVPFITGDQPIFNIHRTSSSGLPPERLELFYPLSPRRAMALLELATERSIALTTHEVQQFNEMIVLNSHEQVFSNSGEYLDGLRIGGSSEI